MQIKIKLFLKKMYYKCHGWKAIGINWYFFDADFKKQDKDFKRQKTGSDYSKFSTQQIKKLKGT